MDEGTATYEVNRFAAMTPDEFARHMTGFRPENVAETKKNEKLRFKSNLPEKFDWTDDGIVTRVKDQVSLETNTHTANFC